METELVAAAPSAHQKATCCMEAQYGKMVAMQIYLLRHGIADDPRPGQPDSERALTQEGRKRLRAVKRRAALTTMFTLSSPYLRAMQTAVIFGGEIIQTRTLEPGADPEDAWNEIRLLKDKAQILCATHEPLCGRLAAYLLNAPALKMDVKKGALIRIDVERLGPKPHGTLKWMIAPKLA